MKALYFLERYFERTLLTVALLTMAGILFAQVVMRYFFHSPFVWSEELARYILVWSAIIGVSLAVRERRHISVDFLPLVLGEKSFRVFSILAHLGVLVFSVLMISASIPLMQRLALMGQTSPALGIPMWIVYAAMPVGFSLTLIRTLQALYIDFVAKRVEIRPQGDL